MNNNILLCYNLFNANYYNILKEDFLLLSDGQLPLNRKPSSSCKKCYGRGYIGKNTSDFTYMPCYCLKKQINVDILLSKNAKEENL
jgi:hypothetical protein